MIDSAISDASTSSDSVVPSDAAYRSFRAQETDRTALLDPPIQDAELLLKQNLIRKQNVTDRDAEASSGPDQASEFWSDLSRVARHQLLGDAVRYTSAYRDVSLRVEESQVAASPVVGGVENSDVYPIVMAGHQPTLFHPGVWFKNFALQQIGKDLGAHAINLVIDNDVASGRSIRVPVRDSLGRVRASAIGYDVGGVGMPFEQAKIRDLRQFDAFEDEVRGAISPIVPDPLITSLWPHAREAIRRCEIAGCALAQARHALEGEIGWNTLEIPLGVAVRGLPFARFVMEIVDQFECFHEVYNQSARHYRLWHGIRSHAHPVPDLARDDDWWELPLWVYGNDSPMRRGVWVRRIGGRLQISDRASMNGGGASLSGLNGAGGGDASIMVPASNRDVAANILAEAASPEFKLRPRALVTTMFARLVLSDLFLHGIGGGKYDQLADRIIGQFFGVVPPHFQVVSATVRLPGQMIDEGRVGEIDRLKRQIRDTHYQGERFAEFVSANSSGASIARLVEAKRSLLAELGERESTHESGKLSRKQSWPGKGRWHRELAAINSQLSDWLEPQRLKLRAELGNLYQQQSEEAILASREWSFCLFGLPDLVSSFSEMLNSNSG